MKINDLAVVGATGLVGRLVLEKLEERNFPAANVEIFSKDGGQKISFRGKELTAQALQHADFSKYQLALFCVPTDVSIEYVPKATAAGCIVIDNSSHWRTDPEVPLIIPEVNGDKIAGYKNKNIITNANCAAIQLIMALKPLHDHAGAKRVVVSSYQSVSGIGKDAMDELEEATKAGLDETEHKPRNFRKNIAFNVVPQIDKFMDDGNTYEEWKMQHDINKIIGAEIPTSATSVRVPVFISHSESVNIEFEREISVEKAKELLSAMPGVKVTEGYMTPLEAAGRDEVFISRIRRDNSVKHGLNLWVVSDNLNKGASLNTVQIAEELLKRA